MRNGFLFIISFLIMNNLYGQLDTDKLLYENKESSAGGVLTLGQLKAYIGVSSGGNSGGSVTNVSILNANGLNGNVANSSTTPTITLGTNVNGMVKANGSSFLGASVGIDYSGGTSQLGNGILKNTNGSGNLSIAEVSDFPILNQNTTGNAATVTTNANLNGVVTSVGNTTSIANGVLTNQMLQNNSITIDGVNAPLGSSIKIGLQEVTLASSETNVSTVFNGGIKSTNQTDISGNLIISGGIKKTPSNVSTESTLTVNGNETIIPINNADITNVSVTSGIVGHPIIDLYLKPTSNGSVVIKSNGNETFNGHTEYTLNANSEGVKIRIYKLSSTEWLVSTSF